MFSKPLPFFATTGFTYLAKGDFNAAETSSSGTSFFGDNELSDPYIALDFSTLSDVKDAFIAYTQTFLALINAIISEHKYAES